MFPILLSLLVAVVSAQSALGTTCTITEYSQVAAVLNSCHDILVSNLVVPGGKTLNLGLKTGGSLTFEGTTKFEYDAWDGPLVQVTGKQITVFGAAGSVLDGQGALYWNGHGDGEPKKPKFFKIKSTGGSVFQNVNLLNCPRQCVSIGNSDELTLRGWNIDVSAADQGGLGSNTDGFDISSSTNVIIENSSVKNQDDCVAVNHGSNLLFQNLYCSGGHGISLSVGMSSTSYAANTVSNVTFSDCTVANSDNGIHVKTHRDAATGAVSGVTYRNIKLEGIRNFGINVQQDYQNGGSTGNPNNNIPITGLTLTGVTGTMTGSNSVPVYILCGSGGCSGWNWSGVSVTGGAKSSSCNFTPSGFSC